MLKNYLRLSFRNLAKHKKHALINITGLSIGMAVMIIIGLWIYDELSYNRSFEHYDRIVQIMQHQTFDGKVGTQRAVPYPLGAELKDKYGSDFKYISMSSWFGGHVLMAGENKVLQSGAYMEPSFPEMFSLKMLKGTRDGLQDPHSILLSETAAKACFGGDDPMGRLIRIDNKFDVKVTGVYKDLPDNSDFESLSFISSWKMYIDARIAEEGINAWRSNAFQAYAMLADHADVNKVSAKIRDVKLSKITPVERPLKPAVFVYPMSKWHLYNEWKDGVNVGGRIKYVWLFGIIGVFVLLLACINFMNLSTARSEKRAREVGIRKAVGSLHQQLILQFFIESFVMAALAFLLAILLVQVALPFFNGMADKKMAILWGNPVFWLLGIVFSLVTGFIAGSYPAFYLSSFQPVKVLKGTFKAGRLAAIPRKALVVMQFTVSVILIIGTVVVFRQIRYAQERPMGYDQNGLILMRVTQEGLYKHYDALRDEMLRTGVVAEMSQSSSAPINLTAINNGYDWEGKPADIMGNLGTVAVSHDFGKSMGWQFREGRDFSREYATDSSAVILNEAAAKFMGLKNPVGKILRCDGRPYHIIGVVKDMVAESPYNPVFRTVYMLDYGWEAFLNIRIAPTASTTVALEKIEKVMKKYDPSAPFDYRFVDKLYADKFGNEQKVGKLAGSFAILAIFISCLGLFGMASFVAEQRTKEIGIRKVLGASVLHLWGMLSREFVLLVLISCAIAIPLAGYFLQRWLENYEYHTEVAWWIYLAAGTGALLITLCTVSYQSIRAALLNPVRSLRSE